MKFQQLRNATAILSLGEHQLLIDPMLSEPGTLPGFKVVGGGRRRNPLIPLPPEAEPALEAVTAVVITHEHPDHFDKAGLAWVKERALSVWANGHDAANLQRKGLAVERLKDGALGLRVEVIPSRHGRGLMGWLMGPVAGYFLAHPDEPSVYLTGDSVLTDSVLEAVERLQPDVVVAPAGTANMGFGGDILFSVDEVVALVRAAPGDVILNHLEALDHCATTRVALKERIRAEGLAERVHVPDDGASVVIEQRGEPSTQRLLDTELSPSFQKWITAPFGGT